VEDSADEIVEDTADNDEEVGGSTEEVADVSTV